MANPEHLKILKQGVEAWNKWRREYPDIEPDLRGVDLSGAYLRQANLNKAILSRTNLSYAELQNATLIEADLSYAYFTGASFDDANISRADLSYAIFRSARFIRANLSSTHFFEASPNGANFNGANLNDANLYGVNFKGASFTRANLSHADLHEANLGSVSLIEANLAFANFEMCQLVHSNLTKAILTGARLYGTARDDWIIKNVDCKYVYGGTFGKPRCPKYRDFEPGEFERIYAALPTIEYIFENGMSPLDPLIMDRVVQAIREKRPEFDIKVDSINARGLAPSIKFTVQLEEHKEPALEAVRILYEERVKRLEADKQRLYDLFALAMEDIICKGRLLEQKDKLLADTITYARELQKVVIKEPKKSFTKVAKKKALDVIGGVIEDIAKGQVKEAAEQIIELGKDLGPIIAKTAAYAFFKSMLS